MAKPLRFKETIQPRITAVTYDRDKSGRITGITFGCLSCRTFDKFLQSPGQEALAFLRTRTHVCRRAGK